MIYLQFTPSYWNLNEKMSCSTAFDSLSNNSEYQIHSILLIFRIYSRGFFNNDISCSLDTYNGSGGITHFSMFEVIANKKIGENCVFFSYKILCSFLVHFLTFFPHLNPIGVEGSWWINIPNIQYQMVFKFEGLK